MSDDNVDPLCILRTSYQITKTLPITLRIQLHYTPPPSCHHVFIIHLQYTHCTVLMYYKAAT